MKHVVLIYIVLALVGCRSRSMSALSYHQLAHAAQVSDSVHGTMSVTGQLSSDSSVSRVSSLDAELVREHHIMDFDTAGRVAHYERIVTSSSLQRASSAASSASVQSSSACTVDTSRISASSVTVHATDSVATQRTVTSSSTTQQFYVVLFLMVIVLFCYVYLHYVKRII